MVAGEDFLFYFTYGCGVYCSYTLELFRNEKDPLNNQVVVNSAV